MARTPLAQALQRAAAEAAASQGRRLARRDALKLGGVLGLATAAAAMPFQPGGAKPAPGSTRQIAIVGGGLAGLACAYELKQAGQAVTVFEASDRVGGRSWTLRGAFADNQLVERGGQLIDQSHTAIHQLAGRLGLQTDNLLQAEPNGSEPLYHFDGQPYSYGQATDDLNAVYQKLHGDLSAAGYPTLYNSFTPRGQQLDQMSIVEWINQTVPGGMGSKLGQLLEVAYTIEYGADASQQSALNLLYLLGFSGQGQLRIFGPSNEKYAIRGGCDQLPTRLAAQLQGQIELGQQLVAVRQGGGTVTLTLKQGSRTRTVTLDKVVLALPFSILRSSVDFSGAGFRPLKQTAIRELGMGTNSKLHVQFTDRHWEGLGCNGETFADTGYQTPGTSPGPREAAPASWSTTLAALSGRASALARRHRGPSSCWPNWNRSCPGSRPSGTAEPPSTSGSAIPGPRDRTHSGRLASTPASPGSRASPRATSTSPASTPRSTPRATSTAQSRPASEPPRNCSRPNLSATLPCPAPGRRDRRRGDVHRAANAAACLSTAL